MRRSRVSRILAASIAAWFAVVAVEPALMPTCPTHGGTGGHVALAAHGVSGHASKAGGHASHTSTSPASDTEHHNCLCLSDCCSDHAIAMAARADRGEIPATWQFRRDVVGARVVARFQREHSLPYAHAPPGVVTLA